MTQTILVYFKSNAFQFFFKKNSPKGLNLAKLLAPVWPYIIMPTMRGRSVISRNNVIAWIKTIAGMRVVRIRNAVRLVAKVGRAQNNTVWRQVARCIIRQLRAGRAGKNQN